MKLTIPPVAEGETYIGAISDKNGDFYHLILMAGDNEPAPHEAQIEWAKSIGGDLPNKVESAILFEVAKDQFQPDCYWTNQTYVMPGSPEDNAYAWCQGFDYGYRDVSHKSSSTLRARAVRRIFL